MKNAADKSAILSRSMGLIGGELSTGGAGSAGSAGAVSLGTASCFLGVLEVREGAA